MMARATKSVCTLAEGFPDLSTRLFRAGLLNSFDLILSMRTRWLDIATGLWSAGIKLR
jgi:hypothetical protein